MAEREVGAEVQEHLGNERGRLVETGGTARVFAEPQHAYTRRLLASRPQRVVREVAADAPTLIAARDVRVEFASRYDVRQTLGVTPPPVPDEAAEGELEDEPEPEPDRLPAPVIAMMSTAAGTLVVGAALGFTALSRESDYNRAPSVATADEGKRFAMFADIALGVSLAATTTSVVLYLTSRPAAEDDADDDAPLEPSIAPTVMVAPVLGRGAGGGVVTVRF